jgi:hypothetical protein
MCPPAATSASFGKLGPVVPSHARQVVGVCELPIAAIGGACLVMVDGASGLDRGHGLRFGERARQQQQQRWWRGWLRGEGAFGSFRRLVGQSALAMVTAMIAVRHVQVIDGAVVPEIWVPLRQDAVGVVAVNMGSQTPTTPMAHS